MNFKNWMLKEDNPLTLAKKEYPAYKSDPELLKTLPADNVWFHGSGAAFDNFKIAGMKRRTSNQWNNFLGIHFTSDSNVAYNIATYDHKSLDPKKGFIYEVDLDVKNPIDLGAERDMNAQVLQLAYKNGIVTDKDIKAVVGKNTYIDAGGSWSDRQVPPADLVFKSGWVSASAILNNLGPKRNTVAKFYKKYLKSLGYDGIIYQAAYAGENYSKCVIVFDENQIKILKRTEH